MRSEESDWERSAFGEGRQNENEFNKSLYRFVSLMRVRIGSASHPDMHWGHPQAGLSPQISACLGCQILAIQYNSNPWSEKTTHQI